MPAITTTRSQYSKAKIEEALSDLDDKLKLTRQLWLTESWDVELVVDMFTHLVHRAGALILHAENFASVTPAPIPPSIVPSHVCGDPLEFWCDGCRVLANDAGMALR